MNGIKKCFINTIASSYLLPSKIRIQLYQFMGMNIKASGFRPKCFINSTDIAIGKGCSINYFCQFHSSPNSSITLGENVYVGMNVNFCTISHELGESARRAGNNKYHPINIGNGCWIGANSTILPGVTIGDGTIIAAGAIVTKDCEPNSLYAGNPAVFKKALS